MDNIKILALCISLSSSAFSLQHSENKYLHLQWPSMAVEANEPHILEEYHTSRKTLGYFCFMPKNQEEIDMLYEQYKAGKFRPGCKDVWYHRGEANWDAVLWNIKDELICRLDIGDMKLIDAYIDKIQVFSELAYKHVDKKFLGGGLFNEHFGFHKTLEEIVKYAASTHVRLGRKSTRNCLKQKDVVHIVKRLNMISNSVNAMSKNNVLDAYVFQIKWNAYSSDKTNEAQLEKLVNDVITQLTSNDYDL